MFFKKLISLAVLFVSLSAESNVSFSNYRIYVDKKSSKQDFMLMNKSSTSSECELSLVDYDITNKGQISAKAKGQLAANSAQPYIRVSPRRVKVTPQSTQKVKILARGFNQSEFNELHSYLAISCKKSRNNNSTLNNDGQLGGGQLKSTSFNVTYASHIPIIIRKEQKDVDVNFSDVNILKKGLKTTINLNLIREGGRSVYGSIAVYDDSGKQLAIRAGISSYLQTHSVNKQFTFETPNTSNFTITFEEDIRYGGSITKSITVPNI